MENKRSKKFVMIYREAAKYLEDDAGTLRNRIYKNQKADVKHLKQVYALVCKTIEHRRCLTSVITASQILQKERKLNMNIAQLMTFDLLIGSKRLNCGKCAEKDALLRHKVRLNGEFIKYKLKHPVIAEKQEGPLVRWVRIRKDSQECASMLEKLGLSRTDKWEDVMKSQVFYEDVYVPQLFAIPMSIKVAELPEYKSGELIIQDRASCIPVTIMDPQPGKTYIDSCAAPGNKTSQLAAQSKHVIAFERDKKRAKTLQNMLDRAKLLKKVEIRQMDFTQCDPFEVEGLIVDPSCSGSGIFRATSVTPERLNSLADFQFHIVLHALKFDAKQVVYSTCSIHKEENEMVVKRLLETPEVAEKWKLGNALPNWPRRGFKEVFDGAEKCVRVNPKEDGGIGFFAACFDRID